MKYWKFTTTLINAATNQAISSGAAVHYGNAASFYVSSSNRLTVGTTQNINTTDANTTFYFKAVLDNGWALQKWSLYCAKLPSSSRTQEFTGATAGPWNLSSVASSSSASRVECTITVYIYYETVSVSFDGNGGNAPPETKTVTIGSPYGYLPTPTRSGYAFAGWYTAASGGALVTADTIVTDLSSHTLYAHWTPATSATISFNAHGGSGAPPSIAFTTGDIVAIPDAKPVRSGYIFAGWAVDANGYQVEYFPGKTYYPVNSMTLYAAWRLPLSVQAWSGDFVDQGRLLFSAQYAVANGLPSDLLLLPSLYPYLYIVSCRVGGFSPTYEDPDTLLYIAVDATGQHQQSSISGTIGSASPTIVETARQLVSATKYADQSFGGNGFALLVFGVDVEALEANGYEFVGWFNTKADKSTSTSYYNGTDARLKYGEQLNTTLESLFTHNERYMIAPLVRAKRYVCAFDAQGGTVSPAFKYVVNGATYGDLPTPTLSGYTFAGWYTAASGGTLVTASTVFTSRVNHILYAHWSALGQPRTVYFDPAGGTCPTASIVVDVGQAVGTLPTPSRTGYTFAGWFRSTIASDEVTSSTIMGDEDVTVYAHWTPGSVTITFDANGGTVSEATRTVAIGSQYCRLPVPSWVGHNFAGWYTAASGGVEVTAADYPTASTTLYAHWSNGTVDWWGVIFG